MGSGRFDASDWSAMASSRSYATKRAADIYTASKLDSSFDVKGKVRESCPSADNPNPTPIILAMDVTGSMSAVLEELAKKALPKLCTEIYARRPVSDPHVCVVGMGDFDASDRAPFQASQFEADIRIATGLEKLYLERGGGGNDYEGYAQSWYFAWKHTKTAKRGFIFTFGDELPQKTLTKANIEEIFGDSSERDMSAGELLDKVSTNWEVYHLIVAEGNGCSYSVDRVHAEWQKLLGQRAVILSDVTKLAEVVVSLLEVAAGRDTASVVSSWDGSTAVAVGTALKGIAASKVTAEGMVEL